MSFWSKLLGKKKPSKNATSAPKSKSTDYEAAIPKRTDEAAVAIAQNPGLYKSAFKTSWDAVCPYCSKEIRGRKKPKQRSKFKCPECSFHVWIDPYQEIFPSVYLQDRQGLIAKYLDILNVGKMRMGTIGTVGTTADFWYSADQVEWARGKRELGAAEAGDVLWRLFNYNMSNFTSFLPQSESQNLQAYINHIKSLMEEYVEQEKLLKKQKGKPVARKTIKQPDEPPNDRLQKALANLPMPASFRDAFVPLRQMIRDKKKEKEDHSKELFMLYELLCTQDFLLATPYIEDIGPGYNVAESIPRETWENLEMPYKEIGYSQLKANKTDIKWFIEAWKEPDCHVSAQSYHREVWGAAVANWPAYYRARRVKEIKAMGLSKKEERSMIKMLALFS